jgi:acyl-CoA synthetase (AMP-forming)/AMP-acid ligase II
LYDLATMLPAIAREAAERFADVTAYVAPDGWTLTYRDLDRISDELAVGLARRGLAAGHVLALALPPSPEYPVAYLAAAKLGAITTGVNERLTSDERAALLATAGPRLVLAAPGLEPEGSDVETVDHAHDADGILRALRAPGDAPPTLADDPDRPVAIVFTSGTTGLP